MAEQQLEVIKKPPLIVADWELGVADSPHLGNAMIKKADIESQPGAVLAGKVNTNLFAYRADTANTFTADAGTDICTAGAAMHSTAGTNYDFTAVTFTTTGTLPAGLSTGTIYFLEYIDDTTFYVCTTPLNVEAQTRIDITDAGSGTHTVTPVSVGAINRIVKHTGAGNMNGRLFAHDSNGRIWVGTASNVSLVLMPGNTLTSSAGLGIAIHAFSSTSSTYLFVFRNATIDVADVHDSTDVFGTPSWTAGWESLNTASGDANSHQVILGQDNILYFCDDRYVGSIKENSGSTFAPGTGSTYTFNNQALDLPTGEVAEWLEELGVNLLVAGGTYDKIYPWNRTADSFNLPIVVPENKIKRLKNIGNDVYILAGVRGNIYATQGTYVRHVRKLPDHLVNNANALVAEPVTWGGIDSRDGALLFGVAGQTSANDGGWLLYPNGRLIQDTTPAAGAGNLTAIFADDQYYHFGYASGAEVVSKTRYSSYETILESGLYRVADKTGKATYSTLEVQTAKVATSGNIRVSWRPDSSGSYTTLATFASDSSSISFIEDSIGLIDIENIQIQVEMDGNFELTEVRLFP